MSNGGKYMDKIKKLNRQLKEDLCRIEYLKKESGQWEIQIKDYKKKIEESENILSELNKKISEIKESIPDFDIKTYENYKNYYLTESEISSTTTEIKFCVELINSLYERLTTSLSQQKMLQERITILQKELAQLKAE